jgi:predicted protein tyrosine phosphatase
MAVARHTEPHIIISILSPGAPEDAKLPITESTMGVLRLRFHDIDTEDKSEDFREYIRLSGISEHELFCDPHAQQIVDFALKHKRDSALRAVLVHCEAGVSRSPAVAAAVAQGVFNQDPSPILNEYRGHNRRVFVTTLRAAERLR